MRNKKVEKNTELLDLIKSGSIKVGVDESSEFIRFLESLEVTTSDQKTALKIREFLVKKGIRKK